MAVYSPVLSRKEQGEEREEAHTADLCALFPPCIFLIGPARLSDSVQQPNLCQHFQKGLYASISIKIHKYIAYRGHSK